MPNIEYMGRAKEIDKFENGANSLHIIRQTDDALMHANASWRENSSERANTSVWYVSPSPSQSIAMPVYRSLCLSLFSSCCSVGDINRKAHIVPPITKAHWVPSALQNGFDDEDRILGGSPGQFGHDRLFFELPRVARRLEAGCEGLLNRCFQWRCLS